MKALGHVSKGEARWPTGEDGDGYVVDSRFVYFFGWLR